MPWQHIVILVVWVLSSGIIWIGAEHSAEPNAKTQATFSIVMAIILAILLISGDAALMAP